MKRFASHTYTVTFRWGNHHCERFCISFCNPWKCQLPDKACWDTHPPPSHNFMQPNIPHECAYWCVSETKSTQHFCFGQHLIFVFSLFKFTQCFFFTWRNNRKSFVATRTLARQHYYWHITVSFPLNAYKNGNINEMPPISNLKVCQNLTVLCEYKHYPNNQYLHHEYK